MEVSNEVTCWFRKKLNQLALQGKGSFIQELCTWMVDIIQHEYRYEVEWIDMGYDCSAHAWCTHEGYNLADYQCVGDFLQECNGNTYPTFMSGMGLTTETFEEDLERRVESHYSELTAILIKTIHKGDELAPSPVLAYISEMNMEEESYWWFENEQQLEPLEILCWELTAAFMDEFKQMDMRFVHQPKYIQLATQMHLERLSSFQERVLQQQQYEVIAQRVDRYFALLCPTQKKLGMPQKAIAIDTLRKLSEPPQNLTTETIYAYLMSDYFAARVSKKLFGLCQHIFRAEYGF